jgi:hypothetical protein
MTRKLPYILSVVLLLIFVSKVSAQDVSVATNSPTISPEITTSTSARPSTMSIAAKLKQQEELMKKQQQTVVANIKTDIKQQIKDAIQIRKTDLKEIVASREAEFRGKLQTIKDQKKKALTERINTKLIGVNTRYTDHFTQTLSNLQAVLDKMSTDVNKNAAISAIDVAKLMVENQATKIYTINIAGEETLRKDAGATVNQLRQDLISTYKAIVNAKQAVQRLMQTSNPKQEASASANI